MKLFVVFMLIGLLAGKINANKTATVNKTTTTANKTFVATREWQEIPEGQGVPIGLHVRINLTTGKKEAKLLEQDEETDEHVNESSLSTLPEAAAAASDELLSAKGTAKHKLKISKTLESALKQLPNDVPSIEYSPAKLEEIKQKYSTYEELKKSYAELRENFKSDAEVITRLLQEYHNITKPEQKSQAPPLTAEQINAAQLRILQNFNYLLHQYDNALWFIDSNGLEQVLLPLIVNQTNVVLRVEAMRVLGALTQNNPKAQVKVFEANFGTHLTQVLLVSTNTNEQSTALFAIGSLLRKFPYAQQRILSTSGTQALVSLLSKECELKIKAKVATLISDVITEQQLELAHLSANDELKLEQQYRELHFDVWLQTQSYCEVMDTLITENLISLSEQPDLMEYFAQSLSSTKDICMSLWPQSPQLRHTLLTIRNRYLRTDDEYRLELAQQLDSLLRLLYIHVEL